MKPKLIATAAVLLAFGAAAAFAKDKAKPGAAGGKDKQGGNHRMQIFDDLLKSSDENGDGAVTLAEFLRHQPAGKDAAKSRDWFSGQDRSQDGRLTREDFEPLPPKK